MLRLRRFLSKLHGLFRNNRVEKELAREISSHLALLEDDLRQQGLSQEEARLAARRAYGGVEQAKQLHRDERSILRLERIRQNLRYAFRQLRKAPGFTITVLFTLALGIGANTAIYTVVYATLLAPLPYPHPDQLVSVFSRDHGPISAEDYIDWKRQSSVFEDLHAWTAGSAHSFNIAMPGEPQYIRGMTVTPGYFQMLGSSFYLGRDFLPEEGQPGKDHVVILTHGLWKRLGANPSILGTVMRMNDEAYTVVGVLNAGSADRGPGEVIVPLAFKPDQLNYKFDWLLARGRLKPGITLQQAEANIDAITASIGKIHPERKGWKSLVVPLKNDFVTSDQKLTLWLLLSAVGFILLIACMNIANLLLARGTSRQKEMAVRGSLGATRRTIFSQLWIESLLLAILGGILGLGTGLILLRGLVAIMPPGTIGAGGDLHLNLKVLLYTLAATSLSGILFGCAPAWYSSRIDPAEVLKEGGRTGMGLGRHRLRRALVVGEFALALTLLAGAGLAVHSFWNLLHVDLGVRTDHILTFHLQPPRSRPKEPEQIVSYYRQILDSIRCVPGVNHAAAAVDLPLDRDKLVLQFAVAGGIGSADPTLRPAVNAQQVTPDYLQTFGIRLVSGRMITDQDNASSRRVALVNEDFVKRFLKGTDPLKQRLIIDQILPGVWSFGSPVEWQIVGVISTVRHPGNGHGLSGENPEITLPFWQSPWPSSNIGVNTAEDPGSMLRSIAMAIHKVDPQIALANPATMDEVHDSVLANDRFTAILLASFAGLALLMAAVGIYGVMTFSVAQRSQEIAIRMALGAEHPRVISLIVKEGLVLAGAGLLLGLLGVSLVSHAMRSLLYGVSMLDLPVFATVGFLLLITALLACYFPAFRAASVDPMQTLRME